MVFCDSALLSQLTTFEFHGGEPGKALHKYPYQILGIAGVLGQQHGQFAGFCLMLRPNMA